MNILISAPTHFLTDKFKKGLNNHNVFHDDGKSTEIFSQKFIRIIDGWMVNPCPNYYIDKIILNPMTNLRCIVTPSTGTTHIDLNYCRLKNIKVKSLRGATVVKEIKASSEFTFLLGLMLIRKINFAWNYVPKGKWRVEEDKIRGREIGHIKIGIIGLGRIGLNIAEYFSSYGSNILYYDPFVTCNKYEKISDLKVLVRDIDLLFTCVHVNDETKGIINYNLIKHFKKDILYVNTSRGEICNELDLIRGIKEEIISAAAVDVVQNENTENIRDNILIKFAQDDDRLLITPHMAGLTIDSENKAQLAALNILLKEL